MRKLLVGALLLATPVLAGTGSQANACDWTYSYRAPVYGYYAAPRRRVYSYYVAPRRYAYRYWPRRRVYGYYASPSLSLYVGSTPYYGWW